MAHAAAVEYANRLVTCKTEEGRNQIVRGHIKWLHVGDFIMEQISRNMMRACHLVKYELSYQ